MREKQEKCYYCMLPIYIKVVQNNQDFNTPLSQSQVIEYELFKRTGYCYQVLKHEYCPVCGRKLKNANI